MLLKLCFLTVYNLIIYTQEHRQLPGSTRQLAKRSACEADRLLRLSRPPAGRPSLGPQSRNHPLTEGVGGGNLELMKVSSFLLVLGQSISSTNIYARHWTRESDTVPAFRKPLVGAVGGVTAFVLSISAMVR